jgi:hypothetical protein
MNHTKDQFGFQCCACDELVAKYESEGMTTSDAQGCAGADHMNANRKKWDGTSSHARVLNADWPGRAS